MTMQNKTPRIDFSPMSERQISSRFRDTAELIHTYSGVVIDGDRIVSLGDIRVYRSHRGGTVYAAAWLNLSEGLAHGFGKTSGWGYDRKSMAIAIALEKAGVRVDFRPGQDMNSFVMNEYGVDRVLAAIAEARGIDPGTLRVVENFG